MRTRRVLGWAFLLVGFALVLAAGGYVAYGRWQQARLLARLPTPPAKAAPAAIPRPLWPRRPVPRGAPLARLVIPKIGLVAAVVQGTQAAQLAEGPGHLSTSVLPGERGTSVLAAHNATFFRRINRLRPGDVVVVQTPTTRLQFTVTAAQVVKTGTPVRNTRRPSLVLESCYPLNALYLTPYRYLVYARLATRQAAAAALPVLPRQSWRAALPAFLAGRHLGLATSHLPEGTLTYRLVDGSSAATRAFVASRQPLDVVAAADRLFEALRLLSAARDRRLAQLFAAPPPALATADPLWGAASLRFGSAFNVTIALDRAGQVVGVRAGVTDLAWPGSRGWRPVYVFLRPEAGRRLALAAVSANPRAWSLAGGDFNPNK